MDNDRDTLAAVIERLQKARGVAHVEMIDARRIKNASLSNFSEGRVTAFDTAIKMIGELDKPVEICGVCVADQAAFRKTFGLKENEPTGCELHMKGVK